jgi:DNA-binding LytR/AlgR family response regulator
MLINYLLCDDNLEDLKSLETSLLRYSFELPDYIQYHIDTCTSGLDFLKLCREKTYQVAFLDIEMPGINGLEAAQSLRQTNEDILIIFITSYNQYLRDSFNVQAFQYLDKPLNYNILSDLCNTITKKLAKSNHHIISIETEQGDILINLDELMYIEVSNRKMLSFHLSNQKVYTTAGIMNYWETTLKDYGFVIPCRGKLTNINFVRVITKDQIVLKNGEILPLSRRQSKIIHDLFANKVLSTIR